MKSTLSLQNYKDLKQEILEDIGHEIYDHKSNILVTRCDEPLCGDYYPIYEYNEFNFLKGLAEDLEWETDKEQIEALIYTVEDFVEELKTYEIIQADDVLKELEDTIKFLEFREHRPISKKAKTNGFAYEATPTSFGAVVYTYKDIANLGSGDYKQYSEDTAFITYAYLGRSESDFDHDKAMEGLILTIESMVKEDGYKKIYALTCEDNHATYENLGYKVTDKIDKEKCDKICGARIMNAVYVEKQIA